MPISTDIYIAVGFLALGIFLGACVLAAPNPATFDGDPKAQAALGISPRELGLLN